MKARFSSLIPSRFCTSTGKHEVDPPLFRLYSRRPRCKSRKISRHPEPQRLNLGVQKLKIRQLILPRIIPSELRRPLSVCYIVFFQQRKVECTPPVRNASIILIHSLKYRLVSPYVVSPSLLDILGSSGPSHSGLSYVPWIFPIFSIIPSKICCFTLYLICHARQV